MCVDLRGGVEGPPPYMSFAQHGCDVARGSCSSLLLVMKIRLEFVKVEKGERERESRKLEWRSSTEAWVWDDDYDVPGFGSALGSAAVMAKNQ